MKAFFYTFFLQTKTDVKQMEILIVYYLVPLLFYLIMGFVFQAILPNSNETIIGTMSIFAISMGSFFGLPSSIYDYTKNTLRKSFRASSIPLWAMMFSGLLSAIVHLLITTLIIFFLSPILFDASIPSSIGTYFFTIILLLVSSCLLGTIIALFAKSSGRLALYGQVAFLPTVMLSGIMFPVSLLPQALAALANIIPGKHAMDILSNQANTFSYGYFAILIIVSLLIVYVRLRKLRYEQD